MFPSILSPFRSVKVVNLRVLSSEMLSVPFSSKAKTKELYAGQVIHLAEDFSGMKI